VRDADGNGIVDVLAPGTYGFVRVAMRGMARDRKIHGVGPTPPFMLTRWSDARVTLDDPNTGRRLDLGAFGRPNAEAFERLLVRGEPKP
jgi:putative photosynthetic complex assembly protein